MESVALELALRAVVEVHADARAVRRLIIPRLDKKKKKKKKKKERKKMMKMMKEENKKKGVKKTRDGQ